MPAPVKRSYHSPRRQEQARATRAAIRQAAHDLFLADGYAATTITAIAEAADVAPQTVYSQFGGKAALAKDLLDVSIVGDEDPVPVAERPWFTRVHQPGLTGHERLRRYAEVCRRIYGGAGSAFEIIRRGADSDAELAELWETNRAARRRVVTEVLDAALTDGELRSGLDHDRAVDLLWVLHGPELYHQLIVDCGWDPDTYERWLAGTLCEQLLAQRPDAGG